MRTLLILLLAFSSASQTDGIIFGFLESLLDFGTNIFGNIVDWGMTTANKFVDTGVNIGGTAIGVMVDPFGWWKPSADDHGHLKGEVAKCPARSDILFVFDTSGSMTPNKFDLSKKFAYRLTEHFQISDKDVRFAAITFGSTVREVFKFNAYDKHTGISFALASTPVVGGSTKTYLALDYIRKQDLFSTSNGARKVSSKIVVVITDGSSDSFLTTQAAAAALKNLYHVVAVGIGSGLGIELRNIGSDNLNVFGTASWDGLIRTELRVAKRLCDIPALDGNVPVTGSGGGTCQPGYEKSVNNPSTCVDINECKTGRHDCQQTCINMVPKYRCTCKAGSVINPKDSTKCLEITKCTTPVDIIFVLDASGSMGSDNFKIQQNFVAKVTHHFTVGANGAQFGGLLFATEVQKLFDLNTYTSRTDITSAISEAPYLEGGTNTQLALGYIVEEGMFSPAAGGRSNAPDVVVVVTDGNTSNEASTKAKVAALKAQGARLFAVGIGESVDAAKLADLASNSGNVFAVVDFDLLDYILQSLGDSICSAVSGA